MGTLRCRKLEVATCSLQSQASDYICCREIMCALFAVIFLGKLIDNVVNS
jgi:hypothetical protein